MSKKILVVDDSVTLRSLVVSTLRGAGYEPTEAGNGEEALKKIATHPLFDLVVTDLNMPVMDGFAFIQKVRALGTMKYTPVLLLTTESRTEQKEKAKAIGATGWLTKPFEPKQLLAVVQRVLP